MSEKLGNLTVDNDAIVVDNDGAGNGNVIDPVDIEPPKRGRGRPRKSDGGSDGNSGSDKPGKSARTGNTNRPNASKKTATAAVSTDALAFTIGVIGNFIAARAKMEALALDEDEQKVIAEATGNVLKHYEIPVSEKTAAWVGLATALGTIYGGKITAIKMARAINR